MSDIFPSLFPHAISDHTIIAIRRVIIYMLLLQSTMLQINIEYIIKPGSVESGKGCSVIMKMYVTPCTGLYNM